MMIESCSRDRCITRVSPPLSGINTIACVVLPFDSIFKWLIIITLAYTLCPAFLKFGCILVYILKMTFRLKISLFFHLSYTYTNTKLKKYPHLIKYQCNYFSIYLFPMHLSSTCLKINLFWNKWMKPKMILF